MTFRQMDRARADRTETLRFLTFPMYFRRLREHVKPTFWLHIQ